MKTGFCTLYNWMQNSGHTWQIFPKHCRNQRNVDGRNIACSACAGQASPLKELPSPAASITYSHPDPKRNPKKDKSPSIIDKNPITNLEAGSSTSWQWTFSDAYIAYCKSTLLFSDYLIHGSILDGYWNASDREVWKHPGFTRINLSLLVIGDAYFTHSTILQRFNTWFEWLLKMDRSLKASAAYESLNYASLHRATINSQLKGDVEMSSENEKLLWMHRRIENDLGKNRDKTEVIKIQAGKKLSPRDRLAIETLLDLYGEKERDLVLIKPCGDDVAIGAPWDRHQGRELWAVLRDQSIRHRGDVIHQPPPSIVTSIRHRC